MRRMKEEGGMLALIDAFAFLMIATSLCAALPLLAHDEAHLSTGMIDKARGVHQALLGGNSTTLLGGDEDLALWRYAELNVIVGDEERTSTLLAVASERLQFLLGGCAWEWTFGQMRAAGGVLAGDIYCDRVKTGTGMEFTLRMAPSGVPP